MLIPMSTQTEPTLFTRAATIIATAFDADTGILQLSFSSETPYLRGDDLFGDPWSEVLGHKPDEVDLTRLNAGAPVLLDHANHSTARQVGVVEKALIENGIGRAEVRLSKRADLEGLRQDIADGIIRNVSVGYQIHERVLIQQNDDGPDEYRVTSWTPMEISFVPIPADATVGVGRSQEGQPMPNKATTTQPTPVTYTAEDLATRNADIQEAFGFFTERDGVNDLLIRTLADPTITADAARDSLLTHLGSQSTPANPPGIDITVRDQDHGSFAQGAVDQLLIRGGVHLAEPHPAARDLDRMSLVGMAETMLRHRGVSTSGLGTTQIVSRAFSHSSGDFTNLLANAANKAVMVGYQEEPASHLIWTRSVEIPDFKTASRVQVSEAPGLEEVVEGGEYRYGSFGEDAESYQLKTYGKMFGITRQAIINDDLDALTRIPGAFGASASRKEADGVYSILTTNANMADGNALFHTTHKNLAGTGAALSVTTLGAARAAMRTQKGIAGAATLNLVPRYLIVPAALETDAEQLLASLVDPSKSNSTPNSEFIRGMTLVVDSRLDADSTTAWYLAASWQQVDTIEAAHLAGQPGAFIEQREGWNIDGIEFKARIDFAAAPIDYRGLYKNPGA